MCNGRETKTWIVKFGLILGTNVDKEQSILPADSSPTSGDD
jgi:hypothetical protein